MDKILDKIKIELPEVFITEYNRNSKEAVINKTINYIELGKNNTSKADGIEKLINHLDIKSDEVLVIGNDDNDVDMFKKYKNSGCVANGTYSAKKTASYVSNYDNTNGGVCDIIKKYVKVGR